MLAPTLTDEELQEWGFGHIGRAVKISRRASFHNPRGISLGDYTRIDDFCVISAGDGGIEIGSHVHIAVYVSLIGRAKIILGDFVDLSSRVAVYSSNDDYSGEYLAGPTVDAKFTNVRSAPVVIGRHSIVGSATVILPGVTIGEGAAIGALSLVKSDCQEFGVYAGIPARAISVRSRRLLALEEQVLQEELKRKQHRP